MGDSLITNEMGDKKIKSNKLFCESHKIGIYIIALFEGSLNKNSFME